MSFCDVNKKFNSVSTAEADVFRMVPQIFLPPSTLILVYVLEWVFGIECSWGALVLFFILLLLVITFQVGMLHVEEHPRLGEYILIIALPPPPLPSLTTLGLAVGFMCSVWA